MVDFPNPFAPPEVQPGNSDPQFRMPPFLTRRRLSVVAFILLGATALLIAFNVAGYAALTGSPEVLTWVPYFTLAATMATFSNRRVRSFILAVEHKRARHLTKENEVFMLLWRGGECLVSGLGCRRVLRCHG